jgi:UDP-GlcNAc:undecaprenyl-phosphate/decaprenyl-phosphate GlcNAc-1-phosphate transferase
VKRSGRRGWKSVAATLAAVGTGGVAGGAARTAYTALKHYPPGGSATWSRTNHRGEPVTLLEGPAAAAGAIAAALVAPGPGSIRTRAALALAGAGAAAFGIYDDLAGSGKRRGLRGHLGALAHGEVTTGAVKLGGIGATGLASAVLVGGQPADVVINAGLIAGGANLLNLFDLRPGRAIKVATASAVLIGASGGAGRRAVAAPLGAGLALLPEDLGERAMLGDGGANALGAMLGAAAATSLPRGARLALLTGIVALTAASEKISFTKVIEATPPLRWLDMLGRRPSAPSVPLAAVPSPRRDPELDTPPPLRQ